MKVGIIGLGLMGGSFALDIKNPFPNSEIFGIDSSNKNLDEALELGLIDNKIDYKDLNKMDLILISVPVNKILGLIDKVLDVVGDNTLVFDVGSTKGPICNYLKNHDRRSNFLAAHPMAGTEFSGPKAAIKGLYVGKPNIICEFEKTDKKLGKLALEIFDALEMKTIYMDPKSHDVHVAYVSHLSHVSSFMLGKTVIEKEKNENNIFDLAGSGFESTVRLAKSNPVTWTPIFLQNKTNLAAAIDEYIVNLNLLKQYIVDENQEELNKVLNNTNRIKEILNNTNNNGKQKRNENLA